MKTFALRGHFDIYDDLARDDLKRLLVQKGFAYKEPQMGGGGGVVETITIAWITLKPYLPEILLGVTANAVYDLLKELHRWHKSHKMKPSKYRPDVGITIYPKFKKGKSYTMFIKIDEESDKKKIRKEIKKAKEEQGFS